MKVCKHCNKQIKENYTFISSAVWGGKLDCDPNNPEYIGVC